MRLGPYPLDVELEPGSLGRRFRSSLPGNEVVDVVVESVSVRCDEELFDRSLRRIELMAAISHDHLVPILDAGLDRDQLFIVTPLPDRTADGLGPVGLSAASVMADVGLGLGHIHLNRALHRDLQLRHIGWYGGVVKLGGFGLADLQGTGRTEGIGPIGGILTMAPSVVQGHPATPGSDAYSFGAALHLLATGIAVHPVRAESIAKRVWRIGAEAPTVSPSLPPELVQTVSAFLSADGSTSLASFDLLDPLRTGVPL